MTKLKNKIVSLQKDILFWLKIASKQPNNKIIKENYSNIESLSNYLDVLIKNGSLEKETTFPQKI